MPTALLVVVVELEVLVLFQVKQVEPVVGLLEVEEVLLTQQVVRVAAQLAVLVGMEITI